MSLSQGLANTLAVSAKSKSWSAKDSLFSGWSRRMVALKVSFLGGCYVQE